ncbi:alpha/beta fold hydrolase [Hyphococcus sp.]|uniref:alpha/beta fold hydrolase n=1 Tax=Hyphococcus sp. TaxID=2038636 RepID=UPI003D13F532
MPAPTLAIDLIGPIAVRRNGEPVALPQSKKTRALLAYLALNEGPQRRERLCEIFWQLPDDPRGSLRWALSKLRSVVNDDEVERIKANREYVSFDGAGVSVDLAELHEAAERALGSGDADAMERVALAFGGDLMDDLALDGQPEFEQFRLAERERARVARLKLLRALAAKLDGDHARRADRLYELVEIEPYDADAHVKLVAALAQAGRRAEAERQKALSEKALRGVDGADPSRLAAALSAKPAQKNSPPAPSRAPALRQDIRFCKTKDGVRIAYATAGEGPPLVKAANWLNHLEYDWQSPVWNHVFSSLTSKVRLVRYDARGNGLSDWNVDDFAIERQVDDLEAVVDALQLRRFPLIGISQGCAVSIVYAARHPDRVTKLVLIGGYAKGWRVGGTPERVKQNEAMVTLTRGGWGQDNAAFRQLFTSLFMPDAPPENQQWFNELQRKTTSPENAANLLSSLGNVDVTEHLDKIKAPALVLHARGDLRVPLGSGRELAAAIPDARFHMLESNNHLMPENDPAWPVCRDAVDAFLAE